MQQPNFKIVVVDYGMGNIHSIVKALELYSDHVVFSSDPDAIHDADALVLPGDGAFGAAMQGLNGPIGEVLLKKIKNGTPLLGICIGFQILFADSNEDGFHPGLSLIDGHIRRFSFVDKSIRIPHMGWNLLEFQKQSIFHLKKASPYVYFIHSYRAEAVPEKNVLAYCNYNGEIFPAIVVQNNITAMQFHPEKSDKVGLFMIQQWIESL